MLRTPLPGVLAGTLTALCLAAATPAAAQVEAPAKGAETTPAAAPDTPAGNQPRKRAVGAQLDALRDGGFITEAAHQQAFTRLRDARATLKRLSGRRRAELGAVLKTVEQVAGRGGLSSTRVPLAFETLERNRQWWRSQALVGYGVRVGFKGSRLVWQSYPGQGIQVQWLGTFGKANALHSGKFDEGLGELLDETLALAADRAGGIAFESWFTFGGGRPPWVSGLSTGTGIQAFSRAAQRLDQPRFATAAKRALGVFEVKPPEGVRVKTPGGAHFLQYSYDRKLRILNGFAQALNGLHDMGRITDDARARGLFALGETQFGRELPRADTGEWSRYSVGGKESDLGYHRLLRDFVRGLCERTERELYCTTAARFTADLTTPPTLRLGELPRARKGKQLKLPFTLGRISNVSLVVVRGDEIAFSTNGRFARGEHTFTVPKLKSSKGLEVRLRAVDPAGNAAGATGTVRPRT